MQVRLLLFFSAQNADFELLVDGNGNPTLSSTQSTSTEKLEK